MLHIDYIIHIHTYICKVLLCSFGNERLTCTYVDKFDVSFNETLKSRD